MTSLNFIFLVGRQLESACMHAGSAPAFEFDSETAGTQQQALHFFRAEEGVAQEWQSSSVLLFFWGEEKVY